MFVFLCLWWSDSYVVSSWYVYFSLSHILFGMKLFVWIFVFIPISLTLKNNLPQFWISYIFSAGDGTPSQPWKILKSVTATIVNNFQKQKYSILQFNLPGQHLLIRSQQWKHRNKQGAFLFILITMT